MEIGKCFQKYTRGEISDTVKEFLNITKDMNKEELISYIINNDLKITQIGNALPPLPDELFTITE